MGAIAERAGVSWGAIQHQFGEKDALLDAVLEEAIRASQQNFADIQLSESDPVARVQGFIRKSRDLLGGPIYKVIIEIQMARSHMPGPQAAEWSQFLGDALRESWIGLFGDLGLTKQRLDDSQRFTFAVLSGIAAEAMLFPGDDFTDRHPHQHMHSPPLKFLFNIVFRTLFQIKRMPPKTTQNPSQRFYSFIIIFCLGRSIRFTRLGDIHRFLTFLIRFFP